MESGSFISFIIKKFINPQTIFPPAESPIKKTFLIFYLKEDKIEK